MISESSHKKIFLGVLFLLFITSTSFSLLPKPTQKGQTMNEKIRKHLIVYNKQKGYHVQYDQALIDTLREAKVVWEGEKTSHKLWDTFLRIVIINHMLIGFEFTDYEEAYDLGWRFDMSSVKEYRLKEGTVDVYEVVEP